MIKKTLYFLKTFEVKVILILIIAMLSIGIMGNVLVHKFALDSHFNQLRDKLKIIASTTALSIDVDMLLEVPLNKEGVNTEPFKKIVKKLQKIKQQNSLIRYIYIMTKTDQEGVWQFMVDPEPVEEGNEDATAYPGDKYDASRFPEMLKAFDGPSADIRLEVDEWGVTLSGYAPIYDKDNKAIAMLGVDMLASDVYLTQKIVHRRMVFVLTLGIILSMIFGPLFAKRITGPLKKLMEGTRRISMGDLGYKVKAEGSNEVRELAESFNTMADELSRSQKKNSSYFYDVIQSMVRIVEAKDHYTRGHSERVAEYAEMIASSMALSQDQIEIIKETAMIHDIGKLGIKDDILNKKGKLTDDEWEMIKKHPVIGEDIIKPVSLNSEVLAMIRGHHERHDGLGYPDGLKGEDTNLFAQIICVVDAYDAMISSRAYRQAMPKEKAVDELKKNKGTQFNSRIVDIFLKILEA
ncbi:MAG: HD domain-containing phosphohydrolase [Candidatus Omnitrophota bacterium]